MRLNIFACLNKLKGVVCPRVRSADRMKIELTNCAVIQSQCGLRRWKIQSKICKLRTVWK